MNSEQEQKPIKRCAIVGTAPTWKKTPWDDLSVDILTLNDGYALGWRMGLPQLPRHTVHFDLHPFSEMSFQPKQQARVSALDVPVGAYLRPAGHLDWLKSRPFPVYVNKKPADWPANVHTFPREELEKKYGTYFTSTPAWMLAWAMEQGYNEIHIYGIHLATEYEYISQRPGFEFLLGVAVAKGCKIILPSGCPILRSKHVYAYEPKPDIPIQAATIQVQRIKAEGAKVQKQMAALRLFEIGRKKDLAARLAVLNLELADAQQARQRVQLALA